MGKFKDFIEGMKEGQKLFGETIAMLVNSALLFLVYVLGVGFTFIFARIFSKRFMELSIDKAAKTYWSDLNLTKQPLEEYGRQF